MQVRSMMWKFDRTRKEWKFKTEPLREAVKAERNPLRGWYSIYTFQAEEPVNMEELKWSIRKDETLVLVLFDIRAYRKKDLDETVLRNMDAILTFFTEQKKDILFRPVYDREGRGLENEPDSFEQVLGHLSQIGRVIREGNYSLYVFQGLLIGSWGEMHTSTFLSEEQLKRMKETIAPYLGNEVFLAVRTPAQLRTLEGEGIVQDGRKHADRETRCPLTLFDDGIFGSSTHLGTFGTMTRAGAGWTGAWTREEELGFIHQIAETGPVGGEAVAPEKEERKNLLEKGGPETQLYADRIRSELEKLQITYLNNAHDLRLLDQWKKILIQKEGAWQGKNLYDFIGVHMGYRLLVKRVQAETAGRKKVYLRVEIENIGFANLYRQTEIVLLLADHEKELWQHSFQTEAGKWKPGECCAFELTERAEAGEIFIGVRLGGQKNRPIELANESYGERKKDALLLGHLYLQSSE